jgi:MFS family permease
MIHLLKLRCKFALSRFPFNVFFTFFFASFSPLLVIGRASRKYHRKTLLYISGLGMMIFIFIASMLVRNMDGFSSSQSFLNPPKAMVNRTMSTQGEDHLDNMNDASYNEILLLISILCYNSFSALGVIILPWTLISELYPIQVMENHI